MKKAFTLVEVIITLGIIGIVAALTIPTLLANHKKKEVVVKLEKIYTVMNQAIKLSELENGEVTNWELDFGTSNAPTHGYEGISAWYDKYLSKYLSISKKKKDVRGDLMLYFPDGSILKIERCVYDMAFYMNEKAIKNPVLGKNVFGFRFNPILLTHQQGNSNKYTHMLGKGFEPYVFEWKGTRDDLLSNPVYACKKTGGNYCTKLIQISGWEIPEDYPIRF